MSNIEPTPFGDKYVLVEHIATGGMAEIYRANYTGIEGFAKELVVKTLREEFAARGDVVGMFLDEARVAATLTHNNVVHTYDLGEIDRDYFIAMELLKGEELVNVMRRAHQMKRPLPLELTLGIIMQSCEGLHYVHSRGDEHSNPLGLVHRDINPTNIHVGYDGVCKILDFGIAATRASAVAKKGQVAGKLAYMAPEQLRGETIDLRADIFPLGVVMYEMCLGRRLFRGKREDVTRRVLEGDVPPPTFVDPDFPPALEAIIMRALEVDPGERYQNCDHMFRDVEAFLNEERLSSTPRKLSALMVELFGEGSPAEIDYDDQYDDLEDDALDFDAFEAASAQERDEDEAPDWAVGLAAGNDGDASGRKPALTIGNLEALVAQGKFDDTGAHQTLKSSDSGSRRRPKRLEDRGASARSGTHRAVASDASDSGSRRKRSPSGRQLRPSTGSNPMLSTGPLSPLADPATTRSFGQSVVTEQRKGVVVWAWILGALFLGGAAYMAYTLFTTK